MTKAQWLAASVLLLALVVSTLAGWECTAITSGEGSEQAANANMSMKAWVDGDRARIEFQNSANPMTPPGTYMVTSDGGRTLYLVNPQQKSYSKWDMNAMLGFAGDAMQMMGMSFSPPVVEKLADEKGPDLLGLPTRHVRFRTSYTLTMNFMGMRKSTHFVQDDEMWTTDQLNDKGFNAWLNQKPAKTGNAELDKMLEAELSKNIGGFPLKTISRREQKDSDGTTQSTTTTMTMTSLVKKSPPADAFDLPKGYTEQPMLAGLMPGDESDQQGENTDEDERPSPTPSSKGENPFLNFMQQMQKQQR